jgi:hypothetical protein
MFCGYQFIRTKSLKKDMREELIVYYSERYDIFKATVVAMVLGTRHTWLCTSH